MLLVVAQREVRQGVAAMTPDDVTRLRPLTARRGPPPNDGTEHQPAGGARQRQTDARESRCEVVVAPRGDVDAVDAHQAFGDSGKCTTDGQVRLIRDPERGRGTNDERGDPAE